MIRTSCYIGMTLMLMLCVSGCQWFDKSTAKPYEEISPTIDEQKAALLQQVERKYESPDAHYQLAKLYHADGMYEKAEFEYRVALGFDPVNYAAQAGVIKALKDKGDTAASKMTADIYMNQAGVSAESSLLLGRAFQREGLGDHALACYQQAQNLAPNSAVVFRQIGFYYLAKGDQVRAEENLRRSFQLDPYQPDVAETLGRMGVMVQIPKKPAKSDGFLKNLLKKDDAAQE